MLTLEQVLGPVTEFIDDQDNAGNMVEPDEVLDLLRTIEGHPKDEDELKQLAYLALSKLMEDRVIVAYGADGYMADDPDVEDQLEPWQVDLRYRSHGTPLYFAMAPDGEDT